MAKRSSAPAGWSPARASFGVDFIILAEKDINQVKNRKNGQGTTWSKGHTPRQLGLATRHLPGYAVRPAADVYFLYSHSQITNRYGTEPAGYIGMTREDLEFFVTAGLRVMSELKK